MRRTGLAIVTAMITSILAGCSSAVGDIAMPTDPPPATTATVVAVIDGDTLDVQTSAGEERVRIIGIDTPEIGRDGEPSECYAQEARTFLDGLVYGREVELRPDATQDDTDDYGRALRHVIIDGDSAARMSIAVGAGHEYTYEVPYEGRDEHLAAEEEARAEHAGLWGAC